MMKRLFMMTGAGLFLALAGVGCSNTADGMKSDADRNTAAVEKGAATAAADTKMAAKNAEAATEKAVVTATDRTVEGTKQAGAALEKGVVTAADKTKMAAQNAEVSTEKAAANAAAGTGKALGDAGQAVKHAGKVMTITPKVKAALLRDDTLYPSSNPGLNKIDVDTGSDGQTVYLKGTVTTSEMKDRAGKIAQKTLKDEKTAYKVNNELTVGQ